MQHTQNWTVTNHNAKVFQEASTSSENHYIKCSLSYVYFTMHQILEIRQPVFDTSSKENFIPQLLGLNKT